MKAGLPNPDTLVRLPGQELRASTGFLHHREADARIGAAGAILHLQR